MSPPTSKRCHCLFRQLDNRQTNGQTDICDCRVAFATENGQSLEIIYCYETNK